MSNHHILSESSLKYFISDSILFLIIFRISNSCSANFSLDKIISCSIFSRKFALYLCAHFSDELRINPNFSYNSFIFFSISLLSLFVASIKYHWFLIYLILMFGNHKNCESSC